MSFAPIPILLDVVCDRGYFNCLNAFRGLPSWFASQPVLGTWSTRIPTKSAFRGVYPVERKGCFRQLLREKVEPHSLNLHHMLEEK